MDRVKEIAKILDITEEEARRVLEDDKRIDKGEKLFELTDEQKKAEKKYKNVGYKVQTVDAYGRKRERIKKVATDKLEIVQLLINCLQSNGFRIETLNPERELFLYKNDKKYKIVLSEPRT